VTYHKFYHQYCVSVLLFVLLFKLFSVISCIFGAYQNHFFENSFAAQVYQKQVYLLYTADTPACFLNHILYAGYHTSLT